MLSTLIHLHVKTDVYEIVPFNVSVKSPLNQVVLCVLADSLTETQNPTQALQLGFELALKERDAALRENVRAQEERDLALRQIHEMRHERDQTLTDVDPRLPRSPKLSNRWVPL